MGLKCVSCLSGYSWECTQNGQCDSNANSSNPFLDDTSRDSDRVLALENVGQSGDLDYGTGEEEQSNDVFEAGMVGRGPGLPVREINTYKEDSALKDQQSTGRKRAAIMYPLIEGADCEWRAQTNCGGGSSPIVGCIDGKQEARHHGPDKNTLNNEHGNVHRICHTCHNRWHARNDPDYVWGQIYPLHSPRPASSDELLLNEVSWSGVKLKKVKD